jgi:hypothetical protein
MHAVLKFYPLSIIHGVKNEFSQTLCIVTTKLGHTAWLLRPEMSISQHFHTIMSSIILVPNVSGVQLLPGKTRLTIKLSELEIA